MYGKASSSECSPKYLVPTWYWAWALSTESVPTLVPKLLPSNLRWVLKVSHTDIPDVPKVPEVPTLVPYQLRASAARSDHRVALRSLVLDGRVVLPVRRRQGRVLYLQYANVGRGVWQGPRMDQSYGASAVAFDFPMYSTVVQ